VRKATGARTGIRKISPELPSRMHPRQPLGRSQRLEGTSNPKPDQALLFRSAGIQRRPSPIEFQIRGLIRGRQRK
jgi:hypothetical protein